MGKIILTFRVEGELANAIEWAKEIAADQTLLTGEEFEFIRAYPDDTGEINRELAAKPLVSSVELTYEQSKQLTDDAIANWDELEVVDLDTPEGREKWGTAQPTDRFVMGGVGVPYDKWTNYVRVRGKKG